MSNQWQNLDVNLDGLADVAERIKDLLDPALSFLEAAVAIIEAAAKLVSATNSVLQATLTQIGNLLKSIIGDILYANISLCAHHNVAWDDDWSFAPKKKLTAVGEVTGDSKSNRNYFVDGDIPWKANGLGGWLDDIKASAYNSSNVNAPKTDSDDALTAFFLVLAFPDVASFSAVPRSVRNFLEELNLEFMSDTWDRMKTGYGQSTARLKSGFSDSSEYKLEPFDKGLITGPTSNGDVPIWTSVSLSRLFGPTSEKIFSQIDLIVRALKGFSDLNPIVLMLEGLSRKVQVLQRAIEDLDRLIEDIVAMFEILSEYASWAVVKSDTGGMEGLISEARNATGYPTYGPGAAVAGIVGVMSDPSTGANIAQKFDKLLQIFGLSSTSEGSTFITNLESATSNVITSSGAFDVGA